MPRPRSIPWLLVALGVGFVALSGWSFHRAATGASTVTDPDYYSHGLRYNQTLLEQRAAASLGWQTAIALNGSRLEARLSDGDRQPVSGARGVLAVFRSDLPQPQQLALQEDAPGCYRAGLPAGLAGVLTAQVTFEREGARLQRRLLLTLPRP